MTQSDVLHHHLIDTKMGSLLVISDEEKIYLLEFYDHANLQQKINHLARVTNRTIIAGEHNPMILLKKELDLYFNGQLKQFSTPLCLNGTPFQQRVWRALIDIPYGETRSYLDVAKIINMPTAFRAVARANGANNIPIVIPCHRVINSNGHLGGYSSGIERKKFLLSHEQS